MRTPLLAIACAACGGHRAPEPLSNPGPPGCTIRDAKVESLGPIHLAVDGVPFAKFPSGHFVELEATLAPGKRSVRAATDGVVLIGELADATAVRPRSHALIDGWLAVEKATATDAVGSSVRLEVELPIGIEPRVTTVVQPCSALTFASSPARRAEGETVEMPRGTTAELRAAPGGKVLARIVRPAQDDSPEDVTMSELGRSGDWVRVRVSVPNSVEGWLPASAVREPDDSGDVYGGLIGDEVGEAPVSHLRCRTAVAIHVRSRGRKVHVGAVVPGADLKIGLTKEDGAFSLDLGATELSPFVEDINECDILVK